MSPACLRVNPVPGLSRLTTIRAMFLSLSVYQNSEERRAKPARGGNARNFGEYFADNLPGSAALGSQRNGNAFFRDQLFRLQGEAAPMWSFGRGRSILSRMCT